MEIGLSAQLVRLDNHYGTLSSTVVIQDRLGKTQLKERKFAVDFSEFTDREFSFQTKKIENL